MSVSFQEILRNIGNWANARNLISRELTWHDMLYQHFVNSTRSHRKLTHTFVAENYGTDHIPEMNTVRGYCCVISTCSFKACVSNRHVFDVKFLKFQRNDIACCPHTLVKSTNSQKFDTHKCSLLRRRRRREIAKLLRLMVRLLLCDFYM